MLKNIKRELFAQGLAKGLNVDKAYTEAGFKPGRANASRLKQHPEVQARLAELLTAGAERAEVTVQRVVMQLYELHDKAVAAKQFGPATRCLELIGRTEGAFVDNLRMTAVEGVSDEELLARLAGDDPAKAELLRGLLRPGTFVGRA
jgi:hypothetical protein